MINGALLKKENLGVTCFFISRNLASVQKTWRAEQDDPPLVESSREPFDLLHRKRRGWVTSRAALIIG